MAAWDSLVQQPKTKRAHKAKAQAARMKDLDELAAKARKRRLGY